MKKCGEKIRNNETKFYLEDVAVTKKPPKELIENCFNEYRLQDEVDALKYTLNINKQSAKATRKLEAIKTNVKDQSSVKECLQPKESTPFQLLMAELKNMTMDSYRNKEVGKTRYQVSNLPAEMDLINTTFGKPCHFDGGVAQVINPKITDFSVDPKKASSDHRIYVKSHKDYYPSEQINRAYETPFNKSHRFGQTSGGNWEGIRIKKLMHWINSDPVSKVSSLQEDFYSHSQPRVGEVKNLKTSSLLMNRTFGKRNDLESYGVSHTLKECFPFNPQLIKVMKSLEHVNKLRILLKKRGTSFSQVEEEITNFDKENVKSVHIIELFDVLKKFRIIPDRESFCELLKMFKFVENDKVKYKEAISLLNWKCDFPEIPKIETLDLTYYSTTYRDTIGNIIPNQHPDLRKGMKHVNYDQPSVATAISSNIFAQYGLSYEDLLKPHSKETFLSIIEQMEGFPKECFDSIWEEGLKIDGTGGVCTLTFKTLLDKFIIEMSENENDSIRIPPTNEMFNLSF